MDKATGNKAVIADGAHFKGQIKHTRAIEINGTVEADLKADKVTIGTGGKFVGAINADLVVISGHYDGNMDACSIWATATAQIAGKIQYKTLQMDRGAALNCRVVHNWKPEKTAAKKTVDADAPADEADPKDNKLANETSKDDQATGNNTNANSVNAAAGDAGDTAALAPQPDDAKKNDNSNFRLFAEMTRQDSTDKNEPARGRRLGIFGFGSRAAKLPDAQG
jgi:cytoskeletal protein CcmA (bactofilin family)